ncbi:MAG: hypothetical protein NZ739_10820, partial [Verrucomicrobiae bacterium]|nr:hypothetical protein [Verrucomicrobiae bacterium]
MNEFFNLGKVVQQVQKLVPANLGQRSKRPPARLVALALDRAKLEVAVLKRANGGVEVQNAFSTPLSLDPLTDDPVLVGREIRKKLDAARIRERRCTVCIPTSWVMTLSVKLPDLPESDLQSLLELEAERGFPYAPETLVMAHSRYRAPSGLQYALVVAVPREHTNRLEAVLAAAQLRPVSFSLGITALAQQIVHDQAGAIALVASEAGLNVQVSCGGGIVCLRS